MLGYLFNTNRRVVLDLQNVNTMDCGGLGIIVAKFVEARQASRMLEFCRISEPVLKLFRATDLDSVFTIHQELGTPVRCTCSDGIEDTKPAAAYAREQLFESRIGLTIRDVLRWLAEPAQKRRAATGM